MSFSDLFVFWLNEDGEVEEKKQKEKKKGKKMCICYFLMIGLFDLKEKVCIKVEDDNVVKRKKRTCFVD